MADVLAVRDEYRAQQWAMLIQESKSSGMTNKDFCIELKLPVGVDLDAVSALLRSIQGL